VLIGLDLTLRDKLHDQWQGKYLVVKMGGLIVVAGLISYLLNLAAGQIAIASVLAFTLSMVADSCIYQILKDKDWKIKSNASNTAGALVDSVVFPTVAFGGLMLEIVAMQFVAKLAGGFVWTLLLKRK
jgi:uncharacterized PurR-regulated membrane protein YhhQ (DUF165 family)